MYRTLRRVSWISILSIAPVFAFSQTDNLVGQIVAADIFDSELSQNKGALAGVTNSFDRNTIFFKPNPEPALEYFRNRPNSPDMVSWRPVFAKIAPSSEWGLTTGPIPWQHEGCGKKYVEYVSMWTRDRRDRWKMAVRAEIEPPNESRERQSALVNPENPRYFRHRSK